MIGLNLGLTWNRGANRVRQAIATINALSPDVLLWAPDGTEDTGNAADGVQYSAWTDKSVNARNYAQSTQAQQPTKNGNYLTLAGSVTGGQGFTGPAAVNTLVTGKENLTAATLMRRTSRATSTQYVWRHDIDCAMVFVSGANEAVRFYLNGTGNHAAVSPGDLLNAWRRWVYRFDRAGATDTDRVKIAINGSNQTTTVTGSLNAAIATVATSQVGIGATSTQGLYGDMALYALWGRTLSDGELVTLDAAMAVLESVL
jgi:hypothetical protein